MCIRDRVRRGKVGGFRDDFTPAQAAELEQVVASRLSPRFGYDGAGKTSASTADAARQDARPAAHG